MPHTNIGDDALTFVQLKLAMNISCHKERVPVVTQLTLESTYMYEHYVLLYDQIDHNYYNVLYSCA